MEDGSLMAPIRQVEKKRAASRVKPPWSTWGIWAPRSLSGQGVKWQLYESTCDMFWMTSSFIGFGQDSKHLHLSDKKEGSNQQILTQKYFTYYIFLKDRHWHHFKPPNILFRFVENGSKGPEVGLRVILYVCPDLDPGHCCGGRQDREPSQGLQHLPQAQRAKVLHPDVDDTLCSRIIWNRTEKSMTSIDLWNSCGLHCPKKPPCFVHIDRSMARGVKLPETGECFDYQFEVATKVWAKRKQRWSQPRWRLLMMVDWWLIMKWIQELELVASRSFMIPFWTKNSWIL